MTLACVKINPANTKGHRAKTSVLTNVGSPSYRLGKKTFLILMTNLSCDQKLVQLLYSCVCVSACLCLHVHGCVCVCVCVCVEKQTNKQTPPPQQNFSDQEIMPFVLTHYPLSFRIISSKEEALILSKATKKQPLP